MKTYILKKIEGDFDVDGDLSKPVWNKAKGVNFVCNRDVDKMTEDTIFKAMCSDKYLYICYDAVDSYIKADLCEHNANLYDEDVVEFFITLDGDLNKYLELEFNKNNAIFSAIINNDEMNLTREYIGLDFNLVQTASKIYDKGYVIEAKIDIQKLNTLFKNDFEKGLAYRFNAYRINLMADGSYEYSAYSPTNPEQSEFAFHASDNFGVIMLG